MSNNTSIRHLKGLDPLRAVAAIAVIVAHLEMAKAENWVPGIRNFSYLAHLGHMAVILFFVLSGFLITLLMLKEKEVTGDVNLRGFYRRRILRVWPLYFAVLLISAVVLKFVPSLSVLLLCLTIFPNIAALNGHLGWAASPQIWSLGVEEQFYLLWPLLVRKVKNLPLMFVFVFVLSAWFLSMVRTFGDSTSTVTRMILYMWKYDCLVVGAMAAYVFHKNSRILCIFRNNIVALTLFIIPFGCWFLHVGSIDEVHAVLFALMILSVVVNADLGRVLDIPILNFLGKISYGLYMYHWMVQSLVMKHVDALGRNNLVIYLLTFLVTIGLSTISYYSFERFFLKKKEKHDWPHRSRLSGLIVVLTAGIARRARRYPHLSSPKSI